ncbi:MAG TPA: aldose 1-epimerase [Acidobacteriota bacterium]|nr:aldose 1-epimerase [Acidobacteriota bacterium]
MKKITWLSLGVLLLLWMSPANSNPTAASPKGSFAAQQITIDGVPVVHLTDATRGIEVSILPSIGNIAFEMKIHGKNILYFPDMALSDFQKKPMQTGIPFLAPWANRMDGDGFWANGKKYNFDAALGNYRKDGNGLPIHGLLGTSALWRVTGIGADKTSAHVTSKLEFWKYPDLMAQWPFPHEYEMTYRLADGALEVITAVTNLSAEAMPLAIGFHPYYRIPDVPRDQWILHLPARKAVVADNRRVPTGELKAMDLPSPLPLKDRTLDDGFADLERDAAGRARFLIESGNKKIEIGFGPHYPVAVIWEPALPPGQNSGFICIEPMTGVTNAINLNHAGKYPDLQAIPANGKWTESFWIRATGF